MSQKENKSDKKFQPIFTLQFLKQDNAESIKKSKIRQRK